MNVVDQECVTSRRERSLDASAADGEPPHRGFGTIECRSFWKAGDFETPLGGPSRASDAFLSAPDFDRARVHPKFLHTNATSHKWAFGAIAELLDNAVDEIHNGATFVSIDRTTNLKDNSPMLLFQDDGGGMDPEGMRRCMSLGFSSKRSKTRIGQYGNGFKTSTMRLGADAIVFTRAIRESQETMSIGLLSYTFLRRTMKDDIIVPLLDFKVLEGQIVPVVEDLYDDWDDNLSTILNWSPFSSKEQLLHQFEDMGSHGTKVLIFNLWMNDDGLSELDFDDDDEDILLRDQAKNGGFTKYDKEVVKSHVSYTLKYSLRAYASILYLRKFSNFQIILRGKPVEQLNIADELKHSKTVTYKPQVGVNAQEVSVRVKIGFAKEAPVLGIFGLNVYHKNRLIMPFWKVVQEGSSRGRCVVGILEANFIEPAHDKQDFERTQLFIRLETKLRQIILDFWKNNCHLIGYQSADTTKEKQKLKGLLKSSHLHAQKSQHSMTSAQFASGLAVHAEQECETEATVTGVGVSYQNQPAEHVTGLASDDADKKYAQDFRMGKSDLQQDPELMESMDVMDTSMIEKLCEENIQLFLRREELQQKEPELKQTVEKLEQELEEAKKKYSQLAAELEARKKQRAVK